jgi:hypothetical protein
MNLVQPHRRNPSRRRNPPKKFEDEKVVSGGDFDDDTKPVSPIHEKKIDKQCVLCLKNIVGFGNNTSPLAKGNCCDRCNNALVLPARIKMIKENMKKAKKNGSSFL